ncbi:ferredoxin reductase [Caballeronia temeraria]
MTERIESAESTLTLSVTDKREIAEDIFLFELRDDDGGTLPPFAAGAHVLVRTPAGVARRYSLCNVPAERYRYVIAVKRDASGGGGSLSMARDVHIGTSLDVSSPLNYFALSGDASRYLLIAGGIGITPMRAMMTEIAARGAHFDVIYCTRSPNRLHSSTNSKPANSPRACACIMTSATARNRSRSRP